MSNNSDGEVLAHKIFPAFYIGTVEAATNLDALYDRDISHILTVASGIKPKWPKKFKYMTIDILDMDDQNIKQHFRKTFEFIETGRNDGAVLVHCVAGVSRSATICIAYIIQKLKVTLEDAFGLVKDARPTICPNDGFMKQLKEFEQEILHPTAIQPTPQPPHMSNDKTNNNLFNYIASPLPNDHSSSSASNISPANSSSPSSPPSSSSIPSSASSTPFPSTQSLETALLHTSEIPENAHSKYCCRMCGTYLFNDTDLIAHEKGSGQTSFEWRKRANSEQPGCTSYFVQELTQFGETSGIEGKMTCPKCHSRFGGWNWSGAQCSCGIWVTPAFQVPKARVDVKQIKKS